MAQQKGKGGKAGAAGKGAPAKGGAAKGGAKGAAGRRQPAPVAAPGRAGRDTSAIGVAALRGAGQAAGSDGANGAAAERVPPRLKERYAREIAAGLREEFGYGNVMQVPGLTKIIVNMGVGEAARDAKLIDGAVRDLAVITGQKPAVTRARKSIAQFKLREGMPIGAHVTLRGDRMWEFCDRLLSLALPRIRDFRGLSDRQFDGRGNYTFGLTEQLMFHEINPDQVDRQRGMDITLVTTATTDAEGRSLLRRLGFPFKES
jgi:large subunit ribosomal protein L5